MGRPRSVDPDGNVKWLSVLISADAHDGISTISKERGVKLSVIVREALSQYLSQAGSGLR